MNITNLFFLLTVIASCYTFPVFGQSHQFQHTLIKIEDGLPNRRMFLHGQDEEGFIWMSTPRGRLCRYDGYEFKTYSSDYLNIKTQRYLNFAFDVHGNIWYSAGEKDVFESPAIFNPKTEEVLSIQTYLELEETDTLNKLRFNNFYKDANNHIYLTNDLGEIWVFDGALKKYFFDRQFFEKNISYFPLNDGRGFIWESSSNSYHLINREQKIIQTYNFSGKTRFVSPTNHAFFMIWEENLTALNCGNLWKFDQDSFQIYKNPILPQADCNSFFPPNAYKLHLECNSYDIILSHNTLLIGSPENQLIYKKNISELFLNVDRAWIERSAFLDRQDNLWIATNEGILKIAKLRTSFATYVEGNSLRGFFQVGDSLFVNSFHSKNAIINLKTGEKEESPFKSKFGAAFMMDSQGNLWSGNESDMGFMSVLKKETQQIENIPYVDSAKVSLRIAFENKITKKIWAGTFSGLAYLDTTKQQFVPYISAEFPELNDATISFFYQNDRGIWILSSNGIFLMDSSREVITKYYFKKQELSSNYFNHLHEDADGVFWLAIRDGGLLKWDISKNSTTQFNRESGFLNENIYAVYEDHFGYLWLPSDYGLLRFNKANQIVNTFLTHDGLPHEEFNTFSHYQAADSSLFFGGLNGASSLNPASFLHLESINIPLRLTSFKTLSKNSNQLIDKTQQVISNNKITIHPQDQFFEIKFALFDFVDSKNNQYAWQLEGLENGWHYSKENAIRLHKPAYGKYRLRVKAHGSTGQWSEDEINIPIFVKKPFYLTTEFIIACIVFKILLLFILHQYRLKLMQHSQEELKAEVQKRTLKIEQQSEELKQLDKLKSRFFANITHEFRTPLTLILGPLRELIQRGDLPKENLDKIKIIERNTNRLKSLLDETLELSKLEAGSPILEEKPLLFYRLVHQIYNNFASYAEYRKIELQLKYELPKHLVLKIDDKKFEKILNNLLNNAFKFTPSNGQIFLSVKEVKSYIQINVIDTGKGVSEQDSAYIFDRFYQAKNDISNVNSGGTGIGLSICKEYAKLMGGQVSMVSRLGIGSDFQFVFPKKEVPADMEVNLPTTETVEPILSVPAPSEKSNKPQILLVEDNEDMATYVESILQKHFNIIKADTGKTGLKKLETYPDIDLIISDVMMPEMDGIQLLEKVREHPIWQNKPFIILTALAETEERVNALRIGVDDYITKPFIREELLARVENLIANYNNRKEAASNVHPVGVKIDFETPPSFDTEWLAKLEKIVKENISDDQLDVRDLANRLALSERQLRNKIKLNTGLPPSQYIKEARLLRARQLLESKSYSTIAEVCYAVGFKNPAHFTKVFRQRFGRLPSTYLE